MFKEKGKAQEPNRYAALLAILDCGAAPPTVIVLGCADCVLGLCHGFSIVVMMSFTKVQECSISRIAGSKVFRA
jgi:hypothetical protein